MVTDNTANMRHPFQLVMKPMIMIMIKLTDDHDHDKADDHDHDDHDHDKVEYQGETKNENDELQFWKPIPLKIEGWIGCNAHLLHQDCFKELQHYPRVQSILAKGMAIAIPFEDQAILHMLQT
uniref:Uncharacterized protein n=1 Tax=Amphimedon queenslandica TaxID=400682 RepID=A0A1X7UIA2_AMPQE